MPSKRDLAPEVRHRVKAKAAREQITVKTWIVRPLSAWVAAVVVLILGACAPDSRPAVTTSTPIPSNTIALESSVGQGAAAGTATIRATVRDSQAQGVSGVLVVFRTSEGAVLAPLTATTDARGVAVTELSAPAGTVTVHATVGGVTTAVTLALPSRPDPPTPPSPAPPPAPSPSPAPIPSPAFTATLAATAETVGTPTRFTATAFNGVAPVTVAWQFGDGATLAGTTLTTTHSYAAGGTYSATVTITDATGRTATATTTVSVIGVPPPAPVPETYTVTLTASPNPVVAGSATQLTATAVPVNTTSPPDTFEWYCNGTTLSRTTGIAAHSCTYTTAQTANPKVIVRGGSATGTATTAVTVSPAPAYQVTLTAAPNPVPAQSATTLTANVTAQNGAPAPTTFEWDCGNGTAVAPDGASSHPCTYSTTGTVNPRVTVRGGSATGTGTTPVTVTAAALFVGLTATTLTPAVNADVTFTATVTSTGPVPTIFDWQWDDENDGVYDGTLPDGKEFKRTTKYSTFGTHTMRIRAVDPATGREATGTLRINVQ